MSIYVDERWRPVQVAVGVNDDGKAGPLTRKAIAGKLGVKDGWRAIQDFVGISIDGIPGPRTIKAVRIALGMDAPSDEAPSIGRIAIDIGHANGTGSRGNGLEEHALSERIGLYLKGYLRDYGFDVMVIDFPDKGNTEDLKSTIRAINEKGFDLAVSLHCDWSTSPTSCGGHVCYKPGRLDQKALAEAIAGPLSDLMPGRDSRTTPMSKLGVLNQTRPVTVLCECGFITNFHDAMMLKERPEAIARAIADGIHSYVTMV